MKETVELPVSFVRELLSYFVGYQEENGYLSDMTLASMEKVMRDHAVAENAREIIRSQLEEEM